ncbi:MAG TPA: OmpA family protein [Burkholderiales bacterium]|nr:OmpA family protein [Burkholderiales bacterium]
MTHRFNHNLTGAAVAVALAAVAGTAQSATPGYVSSSGGQVWTSPTGLCWKTTDWTPEKAAAPCDAVRTVQVAAPPPVAVAPPPPAPAPLVTAPPPQPPLIEQISLSSDVLFSFDKAELRPEGQKKIDEITGRLKGANVQLINAIGHADRIGNNQYNQKLSEKRAAAVKDYLAKQGIEVNKVRSEGRGESEPVTGDQCKGVKGSKLISCLQPDRRVDIEVRGEKETASTPTSPSAGGTSGSRTLGTPRGSSSGASPSSGSGSTK